MSTKLTAEYKLFHQSIPVIVPKVFAFKSGISALGNAHTNNPATSNQIESGAMEYELRFGFQLANIIAEGGQFYFQNPERDAPQLYEWLHETLTRYMNRRQAGLHYKDVPLDRIEAFDLLAKYVYERAKAHIKLGPLESGGVAKTARFFANRNFDRFKKTENDKQRLASERRNSQHSSIMEDLINFTAESKFTGNRRDDG